MLSNARANRFLSTITFPLIDFVQYHANSAEVSDLMKAKMDDIAKGTCRHLGAIAKAFSFEFKFNKVDNVKYAFACTLTLEILTKENLTTDMVGSKAQILAALAQSVRDHDQNHHFNFDLNADLMTITSQTNPSPQTRYSNNVAQTAIHYDHLNVTEIVRTDFRPETTLSNSTSRVMSTIIRSNNTNDDLNKFGFNSMSSQAKSSHQMRTMMQPCDARHLPSFSHFNQNNHSSSIKANNQPVTATPTPMSPGSRKH